MLIWNSFGTSHSADAVVCISAYDDNLKFVKSVVRYLERIWEIDDEVYKDVNRLRIYLAAIALKELFGIVEPLDKVKEYENAICFFKIECGPAIPDEEKIIALFKAFNVEIDKIVIVTCPEGEGLCEKYLYSEEAKRMCHEAGLDPVSYECKNYLKEKLLDEVYKMLRGVAPENKT